MNKLLLSQAAAAVVVVASGLVCAPVNAQQQPAAPFVNFTAGNLKTGNRIERDQGATVAEEGVGTYASKTTMRILAVEARLRAFSKPALPFEVQCFFIAKDSNKNLYVYDYAHGSTQELVHQFSFSSRDLFGGFKSTSVSTMPDVPGTGLGSVTVISTETRPGSSVVGWIVRLRYGDKSVKTEASLQELKTFAERESSLLDSVAAPKAPEKKPAQWQRP